MSIYSRGVLSFRTIGRRMNQLKKKHRGLKKLQAKLSTSAKPPLLLALVILLMFTVAACNSQDTQVKSTDAPTTATTDRQMAVKIISVTSPVNPGSTVTLFAQTKPGALCEVNAGYKLIAGEAKTLYPKQAETSGLVSWTWTVDSSATPGKYAATISAKALDGRTDTVTAQTLVEISAPSTQGATTGTTCKK